jgi:hypothetical protein
MKTSAISFVFSMCLTLLCSSTTFSQDQAASEPASTAPVAFVYLQLTEGLYVYSATAAGRLTLVAGSPFSIPGKMEDISGKYLISVGTTKLHVYLIESDGGVGPQVSVINTASYGGSECGSTTFGGSFLDHTGKYLYVQLVNGGNSSCAAWQSYLLEPNGTLTFLGDILYYDIVGDEPPILEYSSVPTVSSNDKFDYGYIGSDFSAFKKGSNGMMEANSSFSHIDPVSGSGDGYAPLGMAADSTGHLGALLQDTGGENVFQLGSYTIDPTSGSIKSTNNYADMPSYKYQQPTISMSPAGNLLALTGPGVEVYHFNGAAPPTPFTGFQFGSQDFFLSAWDKSNHLYAVSAESYAYVFTVTPTTFHQSPGSPYALPHVYGRESLIVVPK